MQKIKLVAEIGWNHMGSLTLAEKMIKAASKSGANYAKFQTWQVKNLKPGPWDKDGRRQIYEKAELSKPDYKKLSQICKYYNIKFLTSLFNHEDFKLIKDLNLKEIKIPSPENRNKNLLKFCSKNFKNIYLSTGAASIAEIKKSFKLLKNNKVNLMHCVSAYPCDPNLVNLNRINLLKNITTDVGLSDHSEGILSATLSLSMGVTLVEKHFTTNNNLPGRDNKFAILPKAMKELSQNIKKFYSMSDSKKLGFIKQEKEVRKVYSGRWIS